MWWASAQAQTALQAADVLCGYTVYIDLVRPLYPEKEVYATGMMRELDRCRWALETAKGGKTVALVCSGDAGVYGAFPDRPYDSPGTWGDPTKINRILANDTCKRA